ncbi:MAG TPA: hypothetical protein VD963_06775 [Phycisphaerales bacterium]|nr:hypothetical protein [Phycisphaerales bacterium]
MNYRTGVILGLRLLGLALLIYSSAGLAVFLMSLLAIVVAGAQGVPGASTAGTAGALFLLGNSAGALAWFALGAYFFLRGRWVHARLFRGLSAEACGGCGYPLAGLTAGKCPECGLRFVGAAPAR